MSNLTQHLKNFGGDFSLPSATTSPAKTIVYKDVNGQVRIPNSGVIIAGQPEALVGLTFTTENDRGKTG